MELKNKYSIVESIVALEWYLPNLNDDSNGWKWHLIPPGIEAVLIVQCF